jgi:hypothetical protein
VDQFWMQININVIAKQNGAFNLIPFIVDL